MQKKIIMFSMLLALINFGGCKKGEEPQKEESQESYNEHSDDFFDYFIEIEDISVKTQVANEVSDLTWLGPIAKDGYYTAFEFVLDNDIEYEVVKSLVGGGKIDPDYGYLEGKTALMYAAQRNTDVEVVNCLLTYAKKINATNDNKWTAAMYAARYNPNPEIFEQFVLKKASLEPNEFGITLTMLAACNPNPAVLLAIPNAKNEINLQTVQGKTALMYACENKQNISTIKILVEFLRADINIADKDGKTALTYAQASYDTPDVIEYLVDITESISNKEGEASIETSVETEENGIRNTEI